jgi:hypothetical protein
MTPTITNTAEVDVSAPDFIRSRLAAVRKRLRRSRGLAGAGLFVAVLGVEVLLLAGLDNLLWLPPVARLILGIAVVGSWPVLFLAKVVWPWVRPLSDESVAVYVESVQPGYGNRLINALQLTAATYMGWSRFMADRAVAESARVMADREDPPVTYRPARKAWSAAGALVVALGLYGTLFGGYLANAAERYFRPYAYLSPVAGFQLTVEPGDADVYEGEALTLRARVKGEMPDELEVEFLSAGSSKDVPMTLSGDAFELLLSEVTSPFSYRCYRGAVTSPLYTVRVRTRPSLQRIDTRYEYPAYTRRAPKELTNTAGDIKALVGTRVTLRAVASKPLASVRIRLLDGSNLEPTVKDNSFSWTFEVEKSGAYTVFLTDRDGEKAKEPSYHRIRAVPDLPPSVKITSPGRDLVVPPGETVPLNFKAQDDIGLSEIMLRCRIEPSGEENILHVWNLPKRPKKMSASYVLRLDEHKLTAGQTLTYQVVAFDGLGRSGPSPMYSLRVSTAAGAQRKLTKTIADLVARLRALLRSQRLNTARTRMIAVEAQSAKPSRAKLRTLLPVAEREQRKILNRTRKLAASVRGDSAFESSVRAALADLTANEMPHAAGELKTASRIGPVAALAKALPAVLAKQGDIERKLVALLKGVEAFQRSMLKGDPQAELDRRRILNRAEVARNMQDALGKFVEEQRKIIRETRELAKKPVEDFTEADDRKAAELAQAQDRLAKIIKDLMDDLSRLPEQDMSDASVAEELVEIYVEVEKARDALTRKTIELAVPYEQAGVELAEQLTKNLEKWLPDTRDFIKWNMEDPPEDMEIPLVDLPEELEDLVGDLIEDQNDLEQDVEDVSSKWADSLDKGAGWSTADGPISNMSAQGKTGNQLPGTNEVGGRSGEGRTGRSHGQMVEKTATGKGGRQTPFRKTPDPYEAGRVDDRSNDPGGGATGGGKLSGAGAEGVRGQTPPGLEKELERLKGRQVNVREKAEMIDRHLKVRRYPSGQVENAVLMMKKAEALLRAGKLRDFAAVKKDILLSLNEARAAVAKELQVNREAYKAMPRQLREDLRNVKKEAMPERYRQFLMRYYRILSRGKK